MSADLLAAVRLLIDREIDREDPNLVRLAELRRLENELLDAIEDTDVE